VIHQPPRDEALRDVAGANQPEIEAFICGHTKLRSTPLLPEIHLRIGGDPTKLWKETQDFVLRQRITTTRSMSPPYWAWPWAGGQAMARHLLERPALVRGKTVLDIASGGAVEGVAASMAGAKRVVCVDIDPLAEHAARINARANQVDLEARTADATTVDTTEIDVILAADLFYESEQSRKLLAWMRREARSRLVLTADPGRTYTPRSGVKRLSQHTVRTNLTLEGRLSKETCVYKVLPE
jgi:predicted nicotinamide N-methyase